MMRDIQIILKQLTFNTIDKQQNVFLSGQIGLATTSKLSRSPPLSTSPFDFLVFLENDNSQKSLIFTLYLASYLVGIYVNKFVMRQCIMKEAKLRHPSTLRAVVQLVSLIVTKPTYLIGI